MILTMYILTFRCGTIWVEQIVANEVYVGIPDPKKVIRHPGKDEPVKPGWGGVKTQTIPSGRLK